LTENEHGRSGLEILKDILVAAQSGALKCHMVYHANSNFKHVKSYLDLALKRGLLRMQGGRFYTTPKGSEFVARFIELQILLYGQEAEELEHKGEVAPVG